jgi:predicted amidophosphoribosyltransferase
MPDVKYVCSECGNEEAEAGMCAVCRTALVATCAECGNPIVGEHVEEN